MLFVGKSSSLRSINGPFSTATSKITKGYVFLIMIPILRSINDKMDNFHGYVKLPVNLPFGMSSYQPQMVIYR